MEYYTFLDNTLLYSLYIHTSNHTLFIFLLFILMYFSNLFFITRGTLEQSAPPLKPREKFSFEPGYPSFFNKLTRTNMDAKTAATKAGLEESTQSLLHRIRITLTSTKTKALEQGNNLSGS